jgi:hypothetical protein
MEALMAVAWLILIVVGSQLLPGEEKRSADEDLPVPAGRGMNARARCELGPLEFRLVRARCGVCGSGMSSRIVLCPRCGTPHHEECWTYAGGCSTYACGASRSIRK